MEKVFAGGPRKGAFSPERGMGRRLLKSRGGRGGLEQLGKIASERNMGRHRKIRRQARSKKEKKNRDSRKKSSDREERSDEPRRLGTTRKTERGGGRDRGGLCEGERTARASEFPWLPEDTLGGLRTISREKTSASALGKLRIVAETKGETEKTDNGSKKANALQNERPDIAKEGSSKRSQAKEEGAELASG